MSSELISENIGQRESALGEKKSQQLAPHAINALAKVCVCVWGGEDLETPHTE